MELIQQLTQGLGVDESQAKGGAGLIFQMAKEQLGKGDFAQVANALPGISNLIGEAPAGGKGIAGAIGGLAGMMGEDSGGGQLANMAALATGFSQLGLNPNMATKFIPIILSFTQNQGGEGIKDILAGVLQ
ncbi:hypothetical protein C7B62_03660 [Pleurocapsa sp. CCALA 161]|uniref:DUF2780 domain-containing protein n=1 Tax=Pleurocapsa sp. CCALA 161 TaxID=2107688 RepID=UPI000D04C16C|nr:DUF2780 domain-containing protein [Pleurocapsa sp. CCALA 161]PSB11992.1 hypothetical protein C7B62_03660 [Pleurocapsa sp. CCALA 161]